MLEDLIRVSTFVVGGHGVGIELESAFDTEHGFGVLLKEDQVDDAGFAEVAQNGLD